MNSEWNAGMGLYERFIKVYMKDRVALTKVGTSSVIHFKCQENRWCKNIFNHVWQRKHNAGKEDEGEKERQREGGQKQGEREGVLQRLLCEFCIRRTQTDL